MKIRISINSCFTIHLPATPEGFGFPETKGSVIQVGVLKNDVSKLVSKNMKCLVWVLGKKKLGAVIQKVESVRGFFVLSCRRDQKINAEGL